MSLKKKCYKAILERSINPIEFNIFFQHNDIKRKFTIVDTPQQNCVLELRNRSLVGGVLTMLQ
jgi:hypothetical protein